MSKYINCFCIQFDLGYYNFPLFDKNKKYENFLWIVKEDCYDKGKYMYVITKNDKISEDYVNKYNCLLKIGKITELILFNNFGAGNKKIFEISNWKDGKKYGICTKYWKNGNIEESSNWINGIKCGECLNYYHSNGKISCKKIYEDGILFGMCIEYDEKSGDIIGKDIYSNFGKTREFEIFELGNLSYKCTIIDNKFQGISEEYKKGKLFETNFYINGEKCKNGHATNN